ncbi:hypothetical protein KC19_9G170400 [Ceratodon purpureus]|uniref:Protein kinase domain-containing protein n=1 Tax=Ceratodon purpureus TaxID=3225 RepID=A0A8T0GWI4_CERPU|nr:hypothetical protein KC19_9G170400 [Ceratodon purpureus]
MSLRTHTAMAKIKSFCVFVWNCLCNLSRGPSRRRPNMDFILFPIGDPLPSGYRLVTVQEVHDHREAWERAMPGWEIANLADGSVDGLSHGGHIRLEIRNDVGHKLATRSESVKNSCTSSISRPAPSASEYFSPSIARMKELMNRPGIDKVEAEIEASKEHWTELTTTATVGTSEANEQGTSERPYGLLGPPDEQLFENHLQGQEWESKTNEQLFQSLEKGEWNSYTAKKTPAEVQANLNFHLLKEDWSRSFLRMDGSTLADKPFAVGGQAEIFLENQEIEESNSNRERHVLKVFKMNKALLDLLRDEIPRGLLKQNVRIGGMPSGRNCRHRCNVKNIVSLNNGRLAFRMPLYGGDLRKFICERKMPDNNNAPFSDDIAILCMLQIAMAMEDLHSDGIVHNDLKAANVLISNSLTGSEPVTREYPLFCWVADYECSIGTIGTGFWRAPEILRNLDDLDLEYFTKASDVYSFGMTCYEILTGLTPFEYERHAQDSYEVVLRGDTPKLPSDIKPWIKALLKKCWHQTPSERPTFEEIVKIIMTTEPSSSRTLGNLLRGSR